MTSLIFVALPLVAFFLLWIVFLAVQSSNKIGSDGWQETLIKTGLFWSAYLVLGTELLSLFKKLTSLGIVLIWMFAIVFLGIVLWRLKIFNDGWFALKRIFTGWKLDSKEILLLAIIFISLVIILINGIMSPPNIHDETIYHMARVMHWRQNQSISYYPTSMTWQLWHPPFSEFVQLHWFLLVSGDNLSSLSQWGSLVLIIVSVTGIGNYFGVNKKGKLLSAIFIMSLPIIVLQASGAKNDIVMGFFFACLAYFVVKSKYQPLSRFDIISTGLAVALGMLTKGNFVFFSFPLLIWLLINIIRSSQWRTIIQFILLGLIIVLLINMGYWFRNLTTFNSPFGTDSANYLMNDRFGVDVTISNLLRNSVIQVNRVGFVTEYLLKILSQVHSWMGLSLYDPGITHGPREFFIQPTREEVVGNPIHFLITLLIFSVLIIYLIRNERQIVLKAFPLAIVAVAGVVFFSSVFRWQVWGNRYFIPYYILFAPLVGLVISNRFHKHIPILMGFVLFSVMINPLINNYSRSFNWSANSRNSIWHRSRRGLRFANHEIYEGAIIELSHKMDISGCRIYGLAIGGNSPEYLIWGTLTPDAFSYYIEHIEVDNQSAIHENKDFDPCGIIVFEGRHPELAFEGGYVMAESWEIPPYLGRPLTLYLKPE